MREHIEMDGYTKAQLTDEYFKKKTKASPQKKNLKQIVLSFTQSSQVTNGTTEG